MPLYVMHRLCGIPAENAETEANQEKTSDKPKLRGNFKITGLCSLKIPRSRTTKRLLDVK